MILHNLLFALLVAVLCLLVLVLLYRFVKKLNLSPMKTWLLSLLLPAGIGFACIWFSKNVYVVVSETDVLHYRAIGSPVYETSSGKEISLDIASSGMIIINETKTPMVLERVRYGLDMGFATFQVIMPNDYLNPDHAVDIDFLMYETPPESLESNKKIFGKDFRYWLRFLTEKEIEEL